MLVNEVGSCIAVRLSPNCSHGERENFRPYIPEGRPETGEGIHQFSKLALRMIGFNFYYRGLPARMKCVFLNSSRSGTLEKALIHDKSGIFGT